MADGTWTRSPLKTVTNPPADHRRSIKRTLSVWSLLAASCAAAIGALELSDATTRQGGEPPQAAAGAFRTASITPRMAKLDRVRWKAIVIHHSGTPGGDAASLERKHVQDGLTGLGYHFLVGNGQGLDDGQVAVGYRWDRQLPGAHVAAQGPAAAFYNEHAVAICLIGNGQRRGFTERQIHQLVDLIRQLQAELGIPASQVRLHSELSTVASPGQFFPTDEVMSQILP